jgi:hypothetical protein
MTQSNYAREKQSRLNLQKDEKAMVNVFDVLVSAPVMGLYMSVA